MLDRRILRLNTKRIFCPICGNWHDWTGKPLQEYSIPDDSMDGAYEYECKDLMLYFGCDKDCINVILALDELSIIQENKVLFEEIQCDPTDPIIKFSFLTTNSDTICKVLNIDDIYEAEDYYDKRDEEFKLNLEFKIEFERDATLTNTAQSNRDERKKIEEETKREQELERQREEAKCERELAKQREEEVKREQELVKLHETKKTTKNKEDTTMANNLFNMNMEFGPNKDENIASTLMGVAVKNGDSWRIYDKKKKEITDVGNMQLGNLPIFILPTTKLSEGDLIKDAGEYYFVIKVHAGSTQTLCAKTGEMKTVVPIKNVLGFSCYSKVIALSDSLNMGDDFDVEKLAIMSAMCGQTGENGGQMNQLLPLMLFKDKLIGDDNTMKLLLMSSMMTSEDDGGQMNQLLPLMLFKDKLGGDDDTMKLLLMSSMMGGNMAGSNNPLMGYLMLDTFVSKKDDKVKMIK